MKALLIFLQFFDYYHVQLILAGLLFWRQMKLRFPCPVAAALLILITVVPFATQELIHDSLFSRGTDMPRFFAESYFLSALGFGLIWLLCFRFRNFREYLFYFIPSIIIQHCLFSLNTILDHMLSLSQDIPTLLLHLAVMCIWYYLIYRSFISRLPWNGEFLPLPGGYLLAFTVLSTFIVYGLSVILRQYESFSYGTCVFDLASCLLILVLHFEKFNQSSLEKEKNTILQILKEEQEKHRLSAQMIEMINRKSHDLKYQIAALKHMSKDDQIRSIDELEKTVNLYDNALKTGNDTLDMLLYERSFVWEKYHINFSCYADGAKLRFMAPEDIYSMFGNALDNAIESVRTINDYDKRIVSMSIRRREKMLVITISNYFNQDLRFAGETLLTTKQDKEHHGFGVKSIQYIAQKYEGTVSILPQDDLFKLVIVLPLPEDFEKGLGEVQPAEK